jgi:mediator of RNA polymerase II transcription subunit 12
MNLDTFHFFPHNTHNSDVINKGFVEKLDVLLTWAVTPLQYGDHRLFAAVTLIGNWRNREHERATRRNSTSPNEALQDQLFEWLDSSETAGDPENNGSVAMLFGRLIDYELFSYAHYIQRLIARGEVGLSFTEVSRSTDPRFVINDSTRSSPSPVTADFFDGFHSSNLLLP